MKIYKNVGLYKLCRIFPEDTTQFPVEKANKKLKEDAPRAFVSEDDISDFDEAWENQINYYDLVEYGEVSERENLARLIEDAKSGKIDHICIYSLKYYDKEREFIFNEKDKMLFLAFNLKKKN